MTPKQATYRPGEIPADLATVTMLRKMRRKPATGQRPVATLVYLGGKEQTDLYRIVDSAPMRPLTARQLAAGERRREYPRICGVCGVDARVPLHPSGPRFAGDPEPPARCGACQREHRYAGFIELRPRNRAEASAWAREVLADPKTVIVAARTIDVRQHELSRCVKRSALSALSIVPVADGSDPLHAYLVPQEPPRRRRDLPAGGVPIRAAAADIVERLRGRRVVAWTEWEVDQVNRCVWDAASCYGREDVPGWPRMSRLCYMPGLRGMAHQYTQWVGHISPLATGLVNQPQPPGEPAEVTDWMLRTLRRMADAPERGGGPGA